MKLYEILNEKYLGRKFKFVSSTVAEHEWTRTITVDSDGKYGYYTAIVDNIEIFTLDEKKLLCDIELIATEEERFDKLITDYLRIVKGPSKSKKSIVVTSTYSNLKSFKENDEVIFINVDNDCISLNFKDFDKIVDYVEKLRELKGDI